MGVDSLVLVIALDHHQCGVTQRSEGVSTFFLHPTLCWKSSMTDARNLRRTPWISQWKTTRSTKERLQRKYFQWLHRLKIHPDSSFSLHTSAIALERAETAPPSERAWLHSRHDIDLNVGLVFLATVILHEKNMPSVTAPPPSAWEPTGPHSQLGASVVKHNGGSKAAQPNLF